MGKNRLGTALLAVMMIVLMLPCAAMAEENLLKNPGFEELDKDGMPTGWYTDAYVSQTGYTSYGTAGESYEGEYCAVVNNHGMNDARFAQKVSVEPNSLYLLSGWIKVDSMLDSGKGANLSIKDIYVFSDSVFESDNDWHYVELYGETGEDQHDVTVFARVGGYSGESQGKAYFDNLSLKKVEGIPGDATAKLWFSRKVTTPAEPAKEQAAQEAKPFWPWLLAISCAYLFAGWWMSGQTMLERRNLKEKKHASVFFWIGMALALAARIIVAIKVEGYQVDVNCFRSWGHTMSSVGASQFYQSTSFCDYTPAYIYVMGFADWLSKALPGLSDAFYHKLVPMLCDMTGAYLLYRFARKERFSRMQAELIGLFVALNPAMFINSAAWCQVDSVLCLGLLLVAMLAVRRRWAALMPVYMLCVLIKPQALMLGPLGLVVIALEWIRHKEKTREMLLGIGLAIVVAAVIVLPFGVNQPFGWLIEKYKATLASYPYATVNTANFYYLFNANWVGINNLSGWMPAACLAAMTLGWGAVMFFRQKDGKLFWLEPALMACFAAAYIAMAFMNVSWAVLGYTTMGLAFAVVLPMLLRSGNVRHVPLLGAVLFIILYVLGVKMHERYLFPALFLLAAAFVLHRDRRTLLLLAVLSCTMLVNEGIVLDNSIRLGSSQGHLNNDTKLLAQILSAINIACVFLAVWTAHDVCVRKREEKLDETPRTLLPVKTVEDDCHAVHSFTTDHKLHWKPLDWVLMLTVTAIYSVVCLCNLGSTKAPQNPWTSTAFNEAVVFDLGDIHTDFTMLYYGQVSYSDFSVAVSPDGETWSDEYWAEMREGQCFRWKYLTPATTGSNGARSYSHPYDYDDLQYLTGRYVRITAQQLGLILNEVVFRDAAGERIEASVAQRLNANAESPLLSDPANLLDEQDTIEGNPSWYNSTYFDEIYHARTAFEHLNGTKPYETSHPPLGKVIMSWFVGLFGMTPFGWRFAGALAGILMLPAMYILGKQLTKRTDMAFAAMTLMALDCMHFTQTRIATIDSFPVFFIILSYLFMLRFMQRDIVLQPLKKILPDLALSGFFMGCGFASKWIGGYAGIGLALLYFWTCIRHICLGCQARKAIKSGETSEELRARSEKSLRRVIVLCLWCLLLFVVIPLAIYLLSYIPYFAYAHVDGFGDFVGKVWDAAFAERYGMLDYHSEPGRGMDHPFYSPWYEWPLNKRPMYYSMAQLMPEGYNSSIFCFGNPVVWTAGLIGILAVAFVWAKRHLYANVKKNDSILHLYSESWDIAPAFVLIGLLAQFLPWVLVPRGTYIYHYFASVPFLILGVMLFLYWIVRKMPVAGRAVLILLLVAALVLFIAFYPYASGVVTPTWWLDFMKQFLRVYYI